MKTIKKVMILTLSLCMLTGLQSYAQDDDNQKDKEKLMAERYERMQKLKIAYITEHLDLSVEEAEKFWPVYRKYEAKRNEITQEMFQRFERPDKSSEELTNEQAKEIILQRLKEERALVELKYQSLNDYLEILPATKVYKLFEVENRFRQHLMQRLREPHEKGRQEPGATGKPMRERPSSRR
jgi:hypothetical protein